MTLVTRADPPVVVAYALIVAVSDGCVNVQAHHDSMPRVGPWINVSVE